MGSATYLLGQQQLGADFGHLPQVGAEDGLVLGLAEGGVADGGVAADLHLDHLAGGHCLHHQPDEGPAVLGAAPGVEPDVILAPLGDVEVAGQLQELRRTDQARQAPQQIVLGFERDLGSLALSELPSDK